MHHGGIEKEINLLIERSVGEALRDLGVNTSSPNDLKSELEIPKERAHGDLASNVAMRCARAARRSPVELANLIKDKMEKSSLAAEMKGAIERLEVKPPGFINIFLSKDCLCNILLDIQREKDDFGSSSVGKKAKLQVEFVSANPTGPLTIAHGRQAAIGDSLANILEFIGYDVAREYYLNDEGTQMNILGNSIRVRYLELCGIKEEFPSDGYKGSYVADLAADFKSKYARKHLKTKELDVFREFGLRWILDDIKKDLKDFGVKFDVWYSQRALRESGKVKKTIGLLKDKGFVYENEGAVWFRSTDFKDDKDRVIIKTDGSMTYLAPDIAYHLEKFKRGFKRVIDLWGPDHHGYIPRMKAAIQALGYPEVSLSVLIVQLATLHKHGEAVSMSTRAGEFVTLREVMDEVGKDVSRFCFIMRRVSSHLDFDLDAVKKESSENPVYYIQYAHARIWSILEYGKKFKNAKYDCNLLMSGEELELVRLLRQFPLVVLLSGQALEPYIIMQYLQDLAAAFHSFYNKHRVVSDDLSLTRSRLVLVDCVRIVLANGLRLLGVSLPRKM